MVKVKYTGVGVVLLVATVAGCDSSVQEESEVATQAGSQAGSAAGTTVISSAGSGGATVSGSTAETTGSADSTASSTASTGDNSVSTTTSTSDTGAPTTPVTDNSQSVANSDTTSNTNSDTTNSEVVAVTNTSNNDSAESVSIETSTTDSHSGSGGNGASAGTSSGSSLTVTGNVTSTSSSSTDTAGNGTAGNNVSVVADADLHRCAQVGDVVDLHVTGVLPVQTHGLSSIDLTSQAMLDVQRHANLQVVSHGDKNLSVTVTSQDILDLLFSYQSQFDLIYLSAIDPATPKPLILKKKYSVDRCSFALYTNSGCAVVASDIGIMSAQVGDVSITADGCTLDNPAAIPVFDLD